ncbi:MAG: dihydrodipicolinate reductase [Nioella sp.]
MRHTLIALLLASLLPAHASAEGFQAVRDRDTFLDLVDGRDLRLGFFGVQLTVTADGQISGQALSSPVTGTWDWRDGYFCRDLDWSGYEIPFNCQLVEARDARQLRFTVDRGAGRSATFRVR